MQKPVWDIPGGPMVKNPPCNAADTGSIPDGGTKIPHAMRCSKTKPNQGLEITILWEVTQKKKTHVI